MGCFADREKGSPEETAKWDYLTLTDFKCTSGWTVAAYVWLWFMAFVGTAVVALDTYTAVNLLAFNHWSSKVKPALDFKYSRWIFAVCILLSFVLLFYELIRAWRVIKRGGVAESFLDPTAVTILSTRPGGGWKRFLVFTELTKSKKGADYVALFVYFSFKGAIRIILAEAPRQCVNAMTLWAVLQADLLHKKSAERSSFDQFWYNVQELANQDLTEAMIYISMLVTLVIWVFSALSLIVAAILYITFLLHYIPQRDGRLSVYCKKKVDKRLAKIVEHKVKAALEDEERKKQKYLRKEEIKRQKTGELSLPAQPHLKSLPTLPNVGDTPETEKQDELPEFPLVRQDTVESTATLPPYTSQPPTRNDGLQRQPTLPNVSVGGRPDMTRTTTQASTWSAAPSYSTNAPLLANAGYAGAPDGYPVPPSAVTRQDSNLSFDQYHGRNDSQTTIGSRRAYAPGPPMSGSRAQTPMSTRPFTPNNGNPYPRQTPAPRIPLPIRSNTAFSFEQGPPSAMSNPSQGPYDRKYPPPVRSNTVDGFRAAPLQHSGSTSSLHSQPSFGRPMRGSQGSFNRSFAAAAPALPEIRSASPDSYEMQSQPSHAQRPPPQQQNGYVAFTPGSNASAPRWQQGPQRNITVSGAQSTGDYFSTAHHNVPQRSATAPLAVTPVKPRHSNYAHDILAEYGASDDEERARRHSPPPQQRSQWPAY
ncbi:vacuolar membrane [Lecanosticta acicola]|uniref:Vacuolar membrane n=1 Tax=Lecanosticta acicola TaxID=111012 RepID=A0AAI9E7Z5_9PEZI|nr:vacuolar membrane [Lecanosticta acicola]